MNSSEKETKVWQCLAASVVILIVLAAIRWSLAHPFGIHWDESEYLNSSFVDSQRLFSGRLLSLGARLLLGSWGRPPAYRILALPFLLLFGFHPTTARLESLTCFGLSCWFIYAAARRMGSATAGAFAVLVFALSSEVVSASIFFGTDAPLFLATSALLYFIFEFWQGRSEIKPNWVGLGVALGLGFMAKTSFFLIGPPVVLFWLVVSRWRRMGIPAPGVAWKSAIIAGVIAGPWWLLNFRSCIAYAKFARAFVRNSLGPPSLLTWARWLYSVFQCYLGVALGIFVGFVFVGVLVRAILKKESNLEPLQRASLGACACAGLPIVFAQLSGVNHLLRHISPAAVPLAIAVGLLASATGWARSPLLIATSLMLFLIQLGMLLYPVYSPNNQQLDLGYINGAPPWKVLVRYDQWDWEPLWSKVQSCGLESPHIAYLGNGRQFNPPAIEYPWIRHDGSADVKWLWRYEDGPIDWQKVMSLANQSDIVITAPNWVGEFRYKEDLDNQHNVQFLGWIFQDPEFQKPIEMKMGRFEPVEVTVSVNRRLSCH